MIRPRILCVDDDPEVLKATERVVSRDFAVVTASSPDGALGLVGLGAPFAVALSDMDMPGMTGAALLARICERSPETTRVLLTGKANLEAAIAAINDGQVFRFLTKPCGPVSLRDCCRAALAQHELVVGARVLLEETLRGSIRALTDILAMASPAAFGRAGRVQRLVSQLAERVGAPEIWRLEIAAMLSQIGAISLPEQTAERLYEGRALDAVEQAQVDQLPFVAEGWLRHIPRLEEVCAIVRQQNQRFDGASGLGTRGEDIPLGARLLKVANDFDLQLSRGQSAAAAIYTLRGRPGVHDPRLLAALEGLQEAQAPEIVRDITLGEARAGMILAEDVRTTAGGLLIAKGFELNEGLLLRLRNLGPGVIEPVVRISTIA